MTQTTPYSKTNTSPTSSVSGGSYYTALKQKKWKEALRLIDEENIDPNLRVGVSGRTAMQKAAYKGNVEFMDALLERGAVLHSDEGWVSGDALVESAIAGKKFHVLEWLLEKGVEVGSYRDTNGGNLMHVAASNGQADLMDMANRLGVPADAPDENGQTPLMVLVTRSFRPDFVRCFHKLLDCGADVNYVSPENETPMTQFIKLGDFRQKGYLLLDNGALVDNPNQQGNWEEICEAGDSFKWNKIRELLQKRNDAPSLDLSEDFTKSALFKAEEGGYCALDRPETWQAFGKICQRLEANGEPLTREDLLRVNADGKTYFQRAAECRALDGVLTALPRGQWPQGEDLAHPEKKGELSALGACLHESGTLKREIFSLPVWQDKPKHTLSRFFDELPEKLQKDVPFRHQFTAALAQSQRTAQGLHK